MALTGYLNDYLNGKIKLADLFAKTQPAPNPASAEMDARCRPHTKLGG
jgi:hypothetical protein